MALERLHSGLEIPEFSVRIPWLITEAELFEQIPETAFTRSIACWPMLRCTVLGFDTVWGFNFVTHPDDLFIGIRYDSEDIETADDSFAAARAGMLAGLGEPNRFNNPDHQRWEDEWCCVNNAVYGGVTPEGQEFRQHRAFFYLRRTNRSQSFEALRWSSPGHSKPDIL